MAYKLTYIDPTGDVALDDIGLVWEIGDIIHEFIGEELSEGAETDAAAEKIIEMIIKPMIEAAKEEEND